MTHGTAPQAGFSTGAIQSKPWGHEQIYAEGENGYVGKLLTVRAGEALSLQYHADKDETIMLISGQAVMEYGPTADLLLRRELHPGEVAHLPATVLHRLTAVTDALLAESSTAAPGWREDVVRVQDRYDRTGTSQP